MSEKATPNIKQITEVKNKNFLSKGFFRSGDGNSFNGLLFFGYINEKDKENKIKFLISYVNSGLNIKPKEFFDKDNFPIVYERIMNKKNINHNNLEIKFSKNSILFSFKMEKNNYEFNLNISEYYALRNVMNYMNNYFNQYETLGNLLIIENHLNEKITPILQKIDYRIFNSNVYKLSKIINKDGEYKDIPNPLIEESFHAIDTVNKQKTHYYIKFYIEYLNSYRNTLSEKDENFSGNKYPFQITVQGTGKYSENITLTEEDFILLNKFINTPTKFIEDNSYNKELIEKGILKTNDFYSLSIENLYQGKKFKNTDEISEKDFIEINELILNGGIEKNKDKILKKVLLIKSTFKKNKFISAENIGTIEVQKQNFLNIKISRTDKGVINDKSGLLQISHQLGNSDFTIKMIKGDFNNGSRNIFGTAAISGEKLYNLRYKLGIIEKFLTNPLLCSEISIYNNIETFRFFHRNEDSKKILLILNKEFKTLSDDKGIVFKEGLFFKKENFSSDKKDYSFQLFIPKLNKELNESIFSIKEDIKGLSDEKYPLFFVIEDIEKKDKVFFKFSIGNIIQLYSSLKERKDFDLLGKKENLYKKIKFHFNNDGSLSLFYLTNSKNEFVEKNIVFSDKLNYETIFKSVENIMLHILNIENILLKGIFYSKMKIFENIENNNEEQK